MSKILEATEKIALIGTEGLPVQTPSVSTAQHVTVDRLDTGRDGGRVIEGDIAPSGNLTLDSTADATKGNVILNGTGGNVGIGLTTPEALLHTKDGGVNTVLIERDTGGSIGFVRSDTSITSSNTMGSIRFLGDDPIADQEGGIVLIQADGEWDTNDFPTRFTWHSDTAGTRTEHFRIDSSGNVGIGTTSPDSRLDIADGALTFSEMTAPSAPAANGCVLFLEDNGAGKTRLMALFNTGPAQEVSIQP